MLDPRASPDHQFTAPLRENRGSGLPCTTAAANLLGGEPCARAARGGHQAGTRRDGHFCAHRTLAACKRLQLCYNRPQGPHSRVVTHTVTSSVYEGPHATAYRGLITWTSSYSTFARRPILSWPCLLRSSHPTYPSPSPVAHFYSCLQRPIPSWPCRLGRSRPTPSITSSQSLPCSTS